MKTVSAILLVLGIFAFPACKKSSENNGNGSSSSRNIKYELTGNYSGQISFISSDNLGNNEMVTVTALPWTREKTYASNIMGIGMGGNSVMGHLGQSGQTVTVKIYAGGKLVRSGTATADVNGILSLPALGFTF